MNNNFEIRKATAEDVALILSLIQELAEYEKLSHEVVANEQILKETLFGPKSHTEVLIGMLDSNPVSFAIFFHNFSSFLGRSGIYLEDLYVRPEARRLGIGQKLLAHLANIAKERNCGRLEWAVLDWNEPAIQFYKSLGARAMDEWTVFRISGAALDKLASNSQGGQA